MKPPKLVADPSGLPCDEVFHRWNYTTPSGTVKIDVTKFYATDDPKIPPDARCQCGRYTFAEQQDW